LGKFAGLVEYDGRDFAGWAAQPGLRTVEETLTGALGTVLRQPIKLTVAGRTDAGVHASGQTVSFGAETELDPSSISYKATAVLPEDLALRRCVAVEEDFDARAVHVTRHLDLGLLYEAAQLVPGKHDFRAFTPAKSHHVRFVRAVEESSWEASEDLLVYGITANSFLYGMIRALVGTMLEVGSGSRGLSNFARLIDGAERSEAGPAAPARGLTLVAVNYDNLDFGGNVP
jgi:tRNA pseudouridine38-40 synthase